MAQPNADEALRNTIKELMEAEMKKKDEEHAKAMGKLKDRIERKRSWDQTNFNKKGHEEQFRHTAETLETVEDALEALEANDSEAAIEILKKGKKSLEDRIQIIKLADREGWLVVKQYKQSLLTSSGELKDKQLKEARKAAENIKRKLEASDQKRNSNKTLRIDEIMCYLCKRLGH